MSPHPLLGVEAELRIGTRLGAVFQTAQGDRDVAEHRLPHKRAPGALDGREQLAHQVAVAAAVHHRLFVAEPEASAFQT